MRFLYIATILLMLQITTSTSAADIYKCADKQGHVAYIQFPCDTQDLKTLHVIKTPDNVESAANMQINSPNGSDETSMATQIQWSTQEQISSYTAYPMSKKEQMCKVYADTVNALDNKIYHRTGTSTSYKLSNLLSQRETYNRLLAMDCKGSNLRISANNTSTSARKSKNIKLSAAIFMH